MIKNERQYRITKAQAERFRDDIQQLEATPSSLHPLLAKAQQDALRSQYEELSEELAQYEALRAGQPRVISHVSWQELPKALIQARIAAGWSQKDLGDRLNLKEQQIQRYEATDYVSASLERIREVASVLEVGLSADIFFPGNELTTQFLLRRFSDMGLDRDFVLQKLLPPDVAYQLQTNSSTPASVMQAATIVDRVFDVPLPTFLGTSSISFDAGIAQTARFKVGARANEKRLSAYTVYAHYVALLLLETTAHIPAGNVPTDPAQVRAEIIGAYGAFDFESALRYMWDIGVPVLPLQDKGAFHGACWRVQGRNVIVLKQQTQSASRWLFDALHEFRHAGQDPETPELAVIEEKESSEERRKSQEERAASRFAGQVILDGQAEDLVNICVKEAGGRIERLKTTVPRVAERHGVSTAALANYMAFRLSLQGESWWPTAQNLQDANGNPWEIARDILLERIDFGRLNALDKGILLKALEDMPAE